MSIIPSHVERVLPWLDDSDVWDIEEEDDGVTEGDY